MAKRLVREGCPTWFYVMAAVDIRDPSLTKVIMTHQFVVFLVQKLIKYYFHVVLLNFPTDRVNVCMHMRNVYWPSKHTQEGGFNLSQG